ncbi:hypothetical protein A3Q56_03037 [Intoshia linei]|uniref:Fatty acyl-CoA reductase n=1 Tax=Intoshia linei TaxID=1819745 RepID=A0A177B4L4_9BILA|nr:hypothetical protein A3Q56_03037 [Intoshia linei]
MEYILMSEIGKFFDSKIILVTGVTGFVGKSLVEKLLRSCPYLKKIYVLIRPSKNQTPNARLEKLLNSHAFNVLRKMDPNFYQKISVISSELSEDNIGLSTQDMNTIINNVDIIFHSAATVRFVDTIKNLIKVNTLGTKKLFDLAKNCKKLQCFIYISTAYSNSEKKRVEEIVYPTQLDPCQIIEQVGKLTEEEMNNEELVKRIIGTSHNAYTFSKKLAENIITSEKVKFQIAVCRPSIVSASYKEPVMGWVDNFNGVSGLMIAATKGFLRTVEGDVSAMASMVPVDYTVNTCIALAWFVTVCCTSNPPRCDCKSHEAVLVVNNTVTDENKISWGTLAEWIKIFNNEIPMEDPFRRISCEFTTNKAIHKFWCFADHMIPAYLVDSVMSLTGQKSKFKVVNIYNRLHKTNRVLTPFINNQTTWATSNKVRMLNKMNSIDQRIFYFDSNKIVWSSYVRNYLIGLKTYVLKEKMENLEIAHSSVKKLKTIRYTFNTMLTICILLTCIPKEKLIEMIDSLKNPAMYQALMSVSTYQDYLFNVPSLLK